MFSWIPIHREAIRKIIEYRKNQKELLTILREMKQKGLKVIKLQDEGAKGQSIPLAEIDPFTFLATFNRGLTEENRQENWKYLKARWSLKAPVPDDFKGIPTLFNMRSWLFPWAGNREKDHVDHLWQVATLAAEGGIENVDEALFDQCLKLELVGIVRLTIGFFWINPEKFLPAEAKTTAYGEAKGITTTPDDYQSYRQWLKEMTEQVGNNYPQVSYDAHLFATQNQSKDEKGGLEIGAEPKPVVVVPPVPTGVAYWWMNANPKIWDFGALPIGGKETYTSHNDKGNKRRIYQHFLAAKPGDIVLGYIGQPQKELVAVCRITQGLHQTKNGAEIEFEKTENLASPISYDTLQASVELAKSEPFVNNLQGSLFKLTEQEYDIIRSLIDETNIPPKTDIENYDKKKAMKSLFLAETQFDEMLAALKEKKNVVLQGAPGVGKTYIAKRLAYALIGSNDPQRIEMIQFHQSYSYEDFIQGFRPTPKGHFDLKYGIFHQFCRRAQREEAQGKPYVFIIDEINRGNLSKIFGELMMLIEPDKRGKEHAIPLAYSQDADERFYIPENLHLIGMMNTADRSLAMVDYALRRRFRFITLRPELLSEAFHTFLIDTGAKPELVKKIIARMTALNEAIAADTKNLGLAYQIGHSYFCPRNGINPDDGWYRRVIESEIVPLIQEYWFDNDQKVKEQRLALLA